MTERSYESLLHALQSGVKMTLELDAADRARGLTAPDFEAETSPKHLRVGVNAAMADHGALVGLLIEKRIFTDEEYRVAIIAGMEREVKTYEDELTERMGVVIHLG